MASGSDTPLNRQINDRIAEAAARLDRGDKLRYEFFCECAEADCMTAVNLTIARYHETVKAGSVLAVGHE